MADYNTAPATTSKMNPSRLQQPPYIKGKTASGALRKYSKGALSGSGAMSIGLGPSAPASGANQTNAPKQQNGSNYESMPVFSIDRTKGIPKFRSGGAGAGAAGRKSETRMASLMSRPPHKSGTTKFDVGRDRRTIASLTSEDIGHFANLSLMSTLRSQHDPSANALSKIRSSPMTSIDNAPSFYEDDLRKKKDKYSASIQDRALYKRTYHSNEKRSIFQSNDNFVEKEDPDVRLAEQSANFYTGGQIQAKHSEFKRVIGRRKSRQSVNAPTNLDIDFVGNSNNYHHWIRGGRLTKDEIGFGMNLRQYKNTTSFNATDAWRLPGPQAFSPKMQYTQTNSFLAETNRGFQGKF